MTLPRLLAVVVMALTLALPPFRATAHPHIFIDTGLEVQFDAEGRVAAVRVAWVYDDFTSLLVLGDMGLIPDAQDRLTPANLAALSGFDMQWDVGFPGDTYLLVNDAPVALGPPEGWTAAYEGGRIITTHLRRLAAPVDPVVAPVVLQVYDPGFYTAYTIATPPALMGRDRCKAVVYGPDRDAADARLRAALAELTDGEEEADFPAIGAAYAEEVRVTCDATP